MKIFMCFLRYAIYLVVAICFSYSAAGSFEDFFVAIKRDDRNAVATLLQRGFDPNTVDGSGDPALLLAVRQSAWTVLEELLRAPDVRVEVRNRADESPLMLAALSGRAALCRQLIQMNADVNKTGWTPLHYAATNGHLEVMQLLLDEHAYIDAESPNLTTPLMMAAHYGTAQAVKLLLDSGADPTLKNIQGLNAIDFAQRANRVDSVQLLQQAIRSRQPKGSW